MQVAALASEIEQHLAATRVVSSQEPSGATLAIPGHSPVSSPDQKFRANGYEESATLVLSYLIGKLRPKIFFDIGAASGHFARVAASHTVAPPIVHAFEMQPNHVASMSERVARDGLGDRVHVHLAGLSDRHEGERDIWFARTKMFEHEPEKHEYQEAWWLRLKFLLRRRYRGPVKARVMLTSIDRFVADHGAVPGLLKIDVDGYEGKVLRGGLRTFAAHKPPIMLELHKDAMIRFGETRRDVAGLLFGAGYKALFLTDHHDRQACRVVPVGPDDPLIVRQETDFILFW